MSHATHNEVVQIMWHYPGSMRNYLFTRCTKQYRSLLSCRHSSSDTLYILDGTSLLYTSFFSKQSQKGQTNAILTAKYDYLACGALATLLTRVVKLLSLHKPEFVAIAFDTSKRTFRHELFAEYKIKRPEKAPDALRPQFPFAIPIIQALGCATFSAANYEADDVMATLTSHATAQGMKVVLVAVDKDIFQLVSPSVTMLHTSTSVLYDESAVQNKFGVSPQLLGDYFSLVGDSSDGIPGVTVALALINGFGSIEEIYNRVESAEHSEERRAALLSDMLPVLQTNKIKLKPETVLKRLNSRTANEVKLYKKLFQLRHDVLLPDLPTDMRQLRYNGISDAGITYLRDLGGQTFEKAVTQIIELHKRVKV